MGTFNVREYHHEYNKLYQVKNREQIRQRKRERRRTNHASILELERASAKQRKADPAYLAQHRKNMRERWHAKKEIRLARQAQTRLMMKLQALRRYGGKCLGCSTTEVAILTFDHVNDDGGIMRRTKKDSNARLLKSLITGVKRTDIQILCGSCQLRKRKYGPNIALWFAHPDNITTSHEIF